MDETTEYVEATTRECQIAAVSCLEQALAAALNEEWDHAHFHATSAKIWLEGCYE